MESEPQETDVAPAPKSPIALSEFMEGTPPSQLSSIADLTEEEYNPNGPNWRQFGAPDIQLHCPEDSCNGLRFFRCTDKTRQRMKADNFSFFYVNYECSNCQKTTKTFSLAAKTTEVPAGVCFKFGELPQYGPPTPARLIKLVGPDRELFIKGRRCENQGLGIGAFVYYRRVIENQKVRILGEIIKVSQKLNVDPSHIAVLEEAQKETQFTKSIESVKHAIPQSLLNNGHNPLLLLHSALSDGLHEQTDEHCLEVASSIRIVLGELSERLSQALKDEAELNNALARLMNKKSAATSPKPQKTG